MKSFGFRESFSDWSLVYAEGQCTLGCLLVFVFPTPSLDFLANSHVLLRGLYAMNPSNELYPLPQNCVAAQGPLTRTDDGQIRINSVQDKVNGSKTNN